MSRAKLMLFNISISSASIFHGRCAVTKWRWCSFERATTLPSSWVNLSRNNCILVRDRWCHLAIRNLVFHNFAIWRATCIETLQDRGDDCYTAGKGKTIFVAYSRESQISFSYCETSRSRTWTYNPFDA